MQGCEFRGSRRGSGERSSRVWGSAPWLGGDPTLGGGGGGLVAWGLEHVYIYILLRARFPVI